VPDAVELLAGTDPNVSDRGAASGNGQAVTGVTVPLQLASEAVLGQPFSYTVTANGGTAPYAWSVAAGILPPGLTIAAGTGTISGTPTTLGSYTFMYKVVDATQATAETVGQINVYKSAPSLATGDINNDGMIDAADVALVERIALGLLVPTQTQLQKADVSPPGNPDGVIDVSDVARIRLKALDLDY
jgi:hypothetical protein